MFGEQKTVGKCTMYTGIEVYPDYFVLLFHFDWF